MQVWNFKIPLHNFVVEMPIGAEILSAGVQGQAVIIWAKVNPSSPLEKRRIPVYGTGHEIAEQDQNLPLISTVFIGPLVFHVFDGR